MPDTILSILEMVNLKVILTKLCGKESQSSFVQGISHNKHYGIKGLL